ncbi:hypothetical protein NF212_19890 [Parasalinivibrio latis]|uniref:hypothetical protein n=1 Tax=Parasalinivibrio latis TaxID=2952610 RepID=UPI0030DE513D
MAYATYLRRHCRISGTKEQLDLLSVYLTKSDLVSEFTLSKGKLSIVYDVRYLHFTELLAMIEKCGARTKRTLFSNWRYNMYDSADLQARDNFRIEPFCCSKVPLRKENL